MASSIDGRLLTERYSLPYDGKSHDEVIGQYYELTEKLAGDAIILGRATVQEFFMKDSFQSEVLTPITEDKTFVGRCDAPNNMIILDPKGKIRYNVEAAPDYGFIAILSKAVSQEYLEHLRVNNISYLFAGEDGKDLSMAMEILGNEFGMKLLLLEGGGFINGTFLKAGLIDEMSLMLYPGIDGLAGIPSIFEYSGGKDDNISQGQALEFKFVETLKDGVLWIRYDFHKI